MNLANLSLPFFLLGLLGLAALLFLLQRLRVKYRDLEVVTTLFWKQAVEETRARIFLRRFRHPWAYLLALTFVALVWLAFADPRWRQDDASDYILLLDRSAVMAWGDRFSSTKDFLQKEIAGLPSERRRVYICGADARLVLDRSEEHFLLGPRLEHFLPEACPPALDRQIRAVAADPNSSGLEILVFGDAPVSRDTVDALPPNVSVKRVRPDDTPSLKNNAGVSGLGVAAATSGAFDRVDAMIRLTGTASVSATLDGRSLSQNVSEENGLYFLRDLPARGQTLQVSVRGNDALTLDNSAQILLPSRNPVAVAVETAIDPRLQKVVEIHPAFDPATEENPARAAVAAAPHASLPTLVVVPGNEIAVTYEESLPPKQIDALRAAFASVGLERVGRKIDSAGNPSFRVALTLRPGTRREVRLGADLLTDEYDLTRSSAFPVLVSEALQWLAGDRPLQSFAAAGENLPVPGDLMIAGASYAPPRAGSYQTGNDNKLEVALGSLPDSAADALPVIASASEGRRWPGLAACCLIVAVVLLLGEWWLFQKGRIP